jgi:branched-chain amino acid transport system permease protein
VLLAQTSDFLPFPNLIPDFEFLEPMNTSSIAGAGHLDHITAIVMVLLTV